MCQEDIITDISEARRKFFGCSGRMLIPSSDTVAALVSTVPENKLITMDALQRALARRFEVEVTCPVAARKALDAIARDNVGTVPYWRVVKKTGELMPRYPGGVEGHAALLRSEGLMIEACGRTLRVAALADSLMEPPIFMNTPLVARASVPVNES